MTITFASIVLVVSLTIANTLLVITITILYDPTIQLFTLPIRCGEPGTEAASQNSAICPMESPGI